MQRVHLLLQLLRLNLTQIQLFLDMHDITTQSYKVVPWKNEREWLDLYHLIFTTQDFSSALDLINLYVLRCSKVAWALPVTANFLALKNASSSDRLVHLSMASSIEIQKLSMSFLI